MLTHLYIQNFTIIDKLDLDLHTGMTVITGETGAGKSIMIDALELALGARAESNVLRHGAERGEIIATFDIHDIPDALKWLSAHELNSDGDCILKRTINSDGRSKSFINNQPVPLQSLRELGSLLINIHGQHEHQSLTQRDSQRDLLDKYAQHEELLEQVKQLYQQYRDLQTEISSRQQKLNDRETRLAFLTFQIQEFDALGLTSEELVNLNQEHKNLANADKYIQACQQALNLLDNAEHPCILSQIQQAKNILSTLGQTNIDELLQNAFIQLKEAFDEIQARLDQYDINPEKLQQIEIRLTKIHDMARKHRVTPEELPQLHARLKQELSQLENTDAELNNLITQLEKITQNYQHTALQLRQSRQQAAKKMANLIQKSMQTLGMPGGNFAIEIEHNKDNQFSAYGLEKIEFMVSANPGQPLQPLNKVASGGELSRISLAIQVIAAQNQKLPTLIFDEVDVGIGGGTAAIVGQLLRKLATTAQVICVTHLPQVAAHGHNHLQVQKITSAKTTVTQINVLSAEDKIQEIARMLGGLKITKQTLAHAKELIKDTI